MMSIGSGYAVVCLESIDSLKDQERLRNSIAHDGLALIPITEDQVNQFAGNMLELQGTQGPILVMSESAYRSLFPSQIKELQRYTTLLHAPLPTIETCGGGSARCMIAEIHLPKQNV